MLAGDEKLFQDFDSGNSETEADVFGTWFARLGAAALLVGAAFGLKGERSWPRSQMRRKDCRDRDEKRPMPDRTGAHFLRAEPSIYRLHR